MTHPRKHETFTQCWASGAEDGPTAVLTLGERFVFAGMSPAMFSSIKGRSDRSTLLFLKSGLNINIGINSSVGLYMMNWSHIHVIYACMFKKSK